MNRFKTRASHLLIALLGLHGAHAAAFTDDFNDGNDTGWSRYSPLAGFGAGSTYSFPGGAYRIQGGASPAPDLLGPQRAGSVRPDQTYSRVRVAADITAWSTEVNQSVGVIARIKDMGLGTTKGYTFNYNSFSGFFQLSRVTNEAPERTVDESPLKLDPTQNYRLVFTAVGDLLLGQAFASTNLTIPLHSIFGQDTAYTVGTAGVFAFALNAGTGIDGRFDNYAADVPAEPVRATVLTVSPRPAEVPAAPIAAVTIRLVDLETAVDSDTIRLEIDGTLVGPLDRVAPELVTLLTWTPKTPLPADQPHTAKLSFADGKGTQEFSWNFGPPATASTTPVLVGTARPEGPYTAETAAVHDAANRRFTVAASAQTRFYRIQDSVARTVKSIAVVNGNAVVGYE